MSTWSNWSGRHSCDLDELHFARSEADVAAVVAACTSQGRTVRVAGAGHSHMPLVPNDHTIIDMSGLAGVVSVDREQHRARIRAGTPIYALGRALHDVGFGLFNQGDIDRQTLGGAVGTGTHGNGVSLTNLSAMVVGARVVLADGNAVECSADDDPSLFQAARLGLGAVGILTEIDMQLRPAYRLREQAWNATYAELRPRMVELTQANRHFEFFYYPHRDTAAVKLVNDTDLPAEYPVGPEGSRVAWSYEVFPNHRPHLHTEMEFSVPVAAGPECLDAIRQLMLDEFTNVRWPIEYRTVAADDVWLSTAYQRAVATISVHQAIDQPDEPFFRACEMVFREFDGRPHWGKVNYFSRTDFARQIPRWNEWWTERNRVDPTGTFLNDYLAELSI